MSGHISHAQMRDWMTNQPEKLAGTPFQASRVLSGAQHMVSLTNDPQTGGASAGLMHLDVYEPGSHHHLVGGAPDVRTGEDFPSHQYDHGSSDPKLTVGDILDARSRMLPAADFTTPRPQVLGTWNTAPSDDRPGRVDVDMSSDYGNKRKAMRETVKRNEDAMFSMKDMSETSNAQARQALGRSSKRPPKADKQEEIRRRAV